MKKKNTSLPMMDLPPEANKFYFEDFQAHCFKMVRRYSENKMKSNCMTPYQKFVHKHKGMPMKEIVRLWRAENGEQPWMKPMTELKWSRTKMPRAQKKERKQKKKDRAEADKAGVKRVAAYKARKSENWKSTVDKWNDDKAKKTL